MAEHEGLIRSKIREPAVGGDFIERPRVLGELGAAAQGRRILLIVASAGSGKTTATVQFLETRPGPRAWLTLADTDDSPGRLVTYLAAAVESIDPAASERARGFLADGLSPEDCAAILGESLPAGATVVIDDLHYLEARASVLRVLRAFLDTVVPGTLVVLVSRRLVHLDLSRDMLAGRVGTVSEPELSFRVDEIAELLLRRGLSANPEEIEASSRGWAAGIVFEALRESQPDPSRLASEDPFFEYLGSEVVGALPPGLREVVLRSALLEVVTAGRLRTLLDLDSADEVFDEICRQHLPGTLGPDGLRYNPRFREFLVSQLGHREPERMRALMARLAWTLLDEGHAEEAADYLLAAGARGDAEAVVETAAPTITARGDWEKALAWCTALGEDALSRRPRLRGLQIRSLLMSRRQDELAALIEGMRESGELDRLMSGAPEVAGWAVWALHGEGRWKPLLRVAPAAKSSRRARVMRYILEVGTGADPPEEWPPEEFDRPQPLHVALESILYYRGRFADVERLVWAAAHRGPVTATLAEIYRVAVLRARGDLADARAVLEATAPRVRASRYIEFWQQVEAELAFAEGDRDDALRLIRAARRTSRDHGYRVAERAVFAVVEGKMLTRMGMIPEAIEVLEACREWCQRHELACFREWADAWLAAALLGLPGHEARARDLLTGAIAGMERADRILELPAAYVFLAEVEWRAGDDDAHDRAADDAYRASVAMGTLGPLLTALDDMPDVLARRIDASAAGDERWRALAQARRAAGRSSLGGARVQIRTLGRAVIEVGEDPVRAVPCPPKAVELAAAVAGGGRTGVSRAVLADELFEGSSAGANYLRQLLHRLRRALPAGIDIASAEGRLAWTPSDAVVVEDQVLEALVLRARRELDEARADSLAAALALADRGPFIPDVRGPSADRRRAQVDALVSEARREYARIQLAAGRPGAAEDLARKAVSADPYSEDGWRLLMRSRAQTAGGEAVVPTFLECVEHLEEIGLTPSLETRALLERLRGS